MKRGLFGAEIGVKRGGGGGGGGGEEEEGEIKGEGEGRAEDFLIIPPSTFICSSM